MLPARVAFAEYGCVNGANFVASPSSDYWTHNPAGPPETVPAGTTVIKVWFDSLAVAGLSVEGIWTGPSGSGQLFDLNNPATGTSSTHNLSVTVSTLQFRAWGNDEATLHLHAEYCGEGVGAPNTVPVSIDGYACVADATFIGAVTGCELWVGPKNPYIGNEQQDAAIHGLTIDFWESATAYGASDKVLLGSTTTTIEGRYFVQYDVLEGQKIWWQVRTASNSVEYVNYWVDRWDLRDAAWSPSSFAATVPTSGELELSGDFRAHLPKAVHWDWLGGTSAADPPDRDLFDWLDNNAPNGFDGPSAGAGAVGLTGLGAVIPLWGMPVGKKANIDIYGKGVICFSRNDGEPGECVPINGGQTDPDFGPWITQEPVVLQGVGRGGIQVVEGTVMIGHIQAQGETPVQCAVDGCPVFGPVYAGPVMTSSPVQTPSSGSSGTTWPTNGCHIATLNLATCLSLLVLPQRPLMVRMAEVQAELQEREPFAAAGTTQGTVSGLMEFLTADHLTLCVPMLEAELAAQGITLARPCVEITQEWTVYGFQPLRAIYVLTTLVIAWLWFVFARKKVSELLGQAS